MDIECMDWIMQPTTPVVYFQPGRPYYIAESDVNDDDNQEEEVSVDSGDDQPSADVESQDLWEVCLITQWDTRQALVPCGHRRFCGSCISH